MPLLKLQDALAALENNAVEPIIKPVPRKGRSVSSDARASLKGHVAGAVQRLCQAGLDQPEARRQVAKALVKLGIKPERGSGNVTATTVRHWCNTVAEDVARTGAAALVFDLMFTVEEKARFARLRPDQARAFALRSLETFVQTVFPGSGVPQKTT